MAGAYVKTVYNVANSNVVSFSPTNAGDWLVVDVDTSTGAGTPTASIADNNTSSYQTMIVSSNYSGGFWHTVFYLENCSASITTITLTFSGGTPGTCSISVSEFSGLATSSSVLANTALAVQGAPGAGVDAITTATLNFSTVPGLLISKSFDFAGGNGFAAGTGFTSDSTTGIGDVWEHRRLTATNAAIAGTYTTASHGTDSFVSWAAAVLEPGGSAPDTNIYTLRPQCWT